MHDANDLYVIAKDAIEEEARAGHEIAQTRPYVVSSGPHLRVLDQVGCRFVQSVEHAVRSVRIIHRNMRPYVDQIFARSMRKGDTRHLVVTKDCDGCGLRS